MHYIELDLHIDSDFADILVAELAEINFDSFVDTEDGIMAYVEEEHFNDAALKQIIERYAARTEMFYSIKKIKKQNWNTEWESNFSPIDVDGEIYIRATFHEPAKYKHEIVITPKMSFGTGHHETTSQMMSFQLKTDHKNKSVLDVGTGTGILAILAAKLGATEIHSFDIDEWSVENTIENIELNHTPIITVNQGTIADQTLKEYDIVLANINRNILLNEMEMYAKFMIPKGHLLISGFYVTDIDDIEKKANEFGLKKIDESSKNNWASVVFIKS